MHKQKGFTFWSLTFTVFTIALVALITMKLLPSYIEFFAIKRAVNRLATNENLAAMDEHTIKRTFERSTAIDDIHSIKPSDLEVRRTPGGDTIVSVDYEVVVPMVANVSALLTFHASTDNGAKGID